MRCGRKNLGSIPSWSNSFRSHKGKKSTFTIHIVIVLVDQVLADQVLVDQILPLLDSIEKKNKIQIEPKNNVLLEFVLITRLRRFRD